MKFTRLVGFGLSALSVSFITKTADAQGCSDGAPRDCWRDHSGSNYNLVDVAPGLACAVFISQLDVRFNDAFQCFRPSGTFNVVGVAPPPNMTTVFGNTTATRLKSISIAPTSGSFGPTVLYALRADGNLYQATCNTAFRDGRDNFTELTLLAPRARTSVRPSRSSR